VLLGRYREPVHHQPAELTALVDQQQLQQRGRRMLQAAAQRHLG
jgi:hypothetical protein